MSKKIFITFLAFSIVLGNFVPVFFGIGVPYAKAAKEISQPQKFLIDEKRFGSLTMDLLEIMDFLEKHGGSLRQYEEIIEHSDAPSGKYHQSAAKSIYDASDQWEYRLDPRIIMTLLELRWNLLNSTSINIDRDVLKESQQKFVYQLMEMGSTIFEAQQNFPQNRTIYLPTGVILQGSTQLTPETFALQKILAELASTEEEWRIWVGDGPGSFIKVYEELFGEDPRKPLKLEKTVSESEAFLERKPFDGDGRVWWLFDHDKGVSGNQRFDNETLSDGLRGISQYGYHTGIDYDTDTDPLYATHTGVIKYIGFWNASCPLPGHEPKEDIARLDIEGPSGKHATYFHLNILRNETGNDYRWKVGDTIPMGTLVGYSDDIGCSDGDHLHFQIDKGPTTNDRFDPYGLWGSNGVVEESFWKSSTMVDNENVGFQHFERQSGSGTTPWQKMNNAVAQGGYAYYVSQKSEIIYHWNNFVVWFATLPKTTRYSVSVYIPDITIAGKTVTNKAKYEIYYNGGSKRVEIDQNAFRGKWVTLADELEFREGTRGAVRLIDETDSSNDGKIMWADAVRWNTSDISINSQSLRVLQTSEGNYDLNFDIENKGEVDVKVAKICFRLWNQDCSLLESLENIVKKTVQKVRFTLRNFFHENLISTPWAQIEVTEVDPEELDMSNNIIDIDSSFTESVNTTDPSGVNFSSIDLSGIQINTDTGSIDFILKGIQGNDVADPDTVREEVRKTFMSSLVIPNGKQIVSLPMGSVNIQSPFEKTDLARVMFEADVAMKFDLFSPSALNLEDLNNQWISLVKGSPYWNELSRKGFNVFPSWQARGTIVPRETLVNVEDDKIFLNQATLGLDTYLEWATIDLSAYGFSTAIVDDINGRLATWKELFSERLRSVAPAVEQKFLTDSKYQKLREAYPAVALAHWYKTLPRENLPYAELIDSENLAGLESETPFDANYWTSQSKQHIGDFVFTDFYGGRGNGYVYGGVQLDIATPEGQGELTENQENILTTVLDEYTPVQEGNSYYLYGGNMTMPSSDLGGYLVIDEDTIVPGKDINVEVKITNNDSETVSETVSYRITAKVINENGAITEYNVVERSVGEISGWSVVSDSVTWKLPNIVGTYTFVIEVDPSDNIHESVETNNRSETIVDVKSAYPEARILYPENGSLISSLNSTFYGSGFDAQDGDILSQNLSWSSDRQGVLGAGNAITVASLLSGLHLITLIVTDNDGLTHSTQINVSVPEPGKPVVKITSPIEGQRLPSDTEVIFTADALDYEDGVLSGDAFSWNSSLDGFLGNGEWLSINDLSIGNHTITLKATDSDELSTDQVVYITVEQGPPVVSLSVPSDGGKFYQHENITFSGSASDLQDGNLSSKMEWYSSRDGLIGTGSSFTKNLSVGEHIITLHIMDSDGQVAEKIVKTRVDYTPPVTVLSSPKNNDEFPYFGSVTFSGSASDTQDGALSGESLIWESSQTGFLGFGSSLTVSNLAPGYHTITLTAVDKDEATDVETITIYIDAGQPRVSIASPTDNQELFYHFPYTFSGSAVDERDGNLSQDQLVWFSNLDGEIGRGLSIIVSSLSVGEHVITLRATDSEGWLGEMSRTITVISPHAPEVSLIKPRDGENMVHGDTLQLRASVWDYEDGALTGNSVVWISNINGEFAHGDNVSFDSTSLSLGNHTITLRATDSLGATSEIITHFTITNRPPVAEILSPTESENIFVQDQTITFNGRGNDLEDASNLSYTWSSNLNGTLGTGTSISIPAISLNVGTHTISFSATDSSGVNHKDEVSIIIVAVGSTLLNTFSDGSREKIFDFEQDGGYFLTNFRLPKYGNIAQASLSLEGQYEEGVNVAGNQSSSIISSSPEFVDIDADGDKDLFTGNGNGGIRFYRNDGTRKDPHFTFITDSFENIQSAAHPVFVDIDNDNDYDLFFGQWEGNINFYRNDGNNISYHFVKVSETYNNIDIGYGSQPAFVDIDADGDYDLFIGASYHYGLYYYRNDGNITEPIWTYISDDNVPTEDWGSSIPSFVDIDSDGDYDVGVNGRFYRNQGSRTQPNWLKDTSLFFYPNGYRNLSPHFVDIDDDNDFDLFFGSDRGDIIYYKNNGTSQIPQFSLVTTTYRGINPGIYGGDPSPSFVDIDADGDEDLFIGSLFGPVSYYQNVGDSTYYQWVLVSSDIFMFRNPNDSRSTHPTFVDLDADNDYDAIVGNMGGDMSFYENIGNAQNPVWSGKCVSFICDIFVGNAVAPIFADIDGDSDYDLFFGTERSGFFFYRNVGTPSIPQFSLETSNYFPQPIRLTPYFIDIDKDGDFDFFYGDANGGISFYKNIGSRTNAQWEPGVFAPYTQTEYVFSENTVPTFADLDNDNDFEMFVGYSEEVYDGNLSVVQKIEPSSLFVDVSLDGVIEWSYPGEFVGTETTSNFAAAVNEYLASATPDAEGNVLVPLQFHSDTAGILKVNNVNVQYTTTDSEPPVFGGSLKMAVNGATSNFVSPNPAYVNQSITIRVSVSDNQGIASVVADVNGTQVILSAQGNNVYQATTQTPNQPGIYSVKITATDLGGIPASITEDLHVVVSGAELALSATDINVSSSSIDEGDTLNVVSRVYNFGDTPASFYVDLFGNGVSIARSSLVTVSENSYQDVSLSWSARYGITTLGVQVDSTSQINEPDETNNFWSTPITVRDITPPSLTDISYNNFVRVGDSIALNLSAIDNTGIATVIAIVNSQTYTLNYNSVTEKYETSFIISTGGEYEMEIRATDVNGLQTSHTELLTVYWSRPDFELKPDDILLSKSDPVEGEEIAITLTTNNVGLEAKTNIKVHFLVDGVLENEQYINLAAPASWNLNFRWTATMGSHTLEFVMDPENQYEETVENNNQVSVVVSVDTVQIPVISEVTLPEDIVEGEEFPVSVGLSETGFTGGEPTGNELVTVETDYGTTTLNFNSANKKFEGRLLYPELGDKKMNVKAQKPRSASYLEHRKVLVRSQYPDFELNEKEFFMAKVKPSHGEVVPMTLMVHNPGGKEINNVPVRMKVDGTTTDTVVVPVLGIGANVETDFNWNASLGDHTLVFEVDPDNTTFEFSEENNIITKSIRVVDIISPTIESITHEEAFIEGQVGAVKVVARDNLSIKRVMVRLGGSESELIYDPVEDAYLGEIIVAESTDPTLEIIVEDEGGLFQSFQKYVPVYSVAADLIVERTGVSFDTATIAEGVPFEVVAQVENHGGTGTGTFSAYLEVDGVLADFENTSVAVGESTEIHFTFTPTFGNHTMVIRLDAGGAVNESHEENNTLSIPFSVADITPPSTPRLMVSPSTWSSENHFTVSWDPTSDAQGIREYLYQIDGGEWISIGVSTSVVLTDILEGSHAVNVMSRDRQGNLSEPGTTFIFYDNEIPSPPILRELHLGGDWSTHLSPYFSWNIPVDNGSGVSSYIGIVDGDESLPIDLGLNIFYHPEFSSGIHTFKVKAKDATGKESEWSNEITVKIDVAFPLSPIVTSTTHPDPDSPVDNNIPTFLITAPVDESGVVGYYYSFSPNSDEIPTKKSLFIKSQGGETIFTIDRLYSALNPDGTPIPDGIWYFHVVTQDKVGNIGTEVSTTKITIDRNETPLLAYDPLPSNDGSNVSMNTLLAWSVGSSCGQTQTVDYEVYLYPKAESILKITTLEDVSCSEMRVVLPELPEELKSDTEYEWFIRAKDQHGSVVQSELWQFTTENEKPRIPLPIPEDVDVIRPRQFPNANKVDIPVRQFLHQ